MPFPDPCRSKCDHLGKYPFRQVWTGCSQWTSRYSDREASVHIEQMLQMPCRATASSCRGREQKDRSLREHSQLSRQSRISLFACLSKGKLRRGKVSPGDSGHGPPQASCFRTLTPGGRARARVKIRPANVNDGISQCLVANPWITTGSGMSQCEAQRISISAPGAWSAHIFSRNRPALCFGLMVWSATPHSKTLKFRAEGVCSLKVPPCLTAPYKPGGSWTADPKARKFLTSLVCRPQPAISHFSQPSLFQYSSRILGLQRTATKGGSDRCSLGDQGFQA